MDRSLWLLLMLMWKGRTRRLLRGLAEPRRAILTLVGLGAVALWILPAMLGRREPIDPMKLRLYGPLGLLAYCLFTAMMSAGEPAISFTAADVQFLFPAPLKRRSLLVYKLIGVALASPIAAAFISLWWQRRTASFLSALVATVLAINFTQLFAMALALAGGTIGKRAYMRTRMFILILVATLVVGAIAWPRIHGGLSLSEPDIRHMLEWRGVRLALWPLLPFAEVFVSTTWPALVTWTAAALAVDGALAAFVLLLDAQYMEASSAAAEKHYARQQAIRRGDRAAAFGAGRATFAVPSLPYGYGVGPVAWRQLTTAIRPSKKRMLGLGVTIGAMTLPMLLSRREGGIEILVPLLSMCTFMVLMYLVFDFRGDLDRMEMLKTLPIRPVALAMGQMLVPVLFLAILQMAILAISALLGALPPHWLAAIAATILPLDLLLVASDNLIFLLFPTRAAATPGDLQFMGRQMISVLMRVMAMIVAISIAAGAGAIVFVISGRRLVPAGITAWLVLVGIDAGLIPLVGWAFTRFDVTRDTPA